MRILFLHGPADLYGASRSLLRLASRLSQTGHHLRVVLPADGDLAKELRLTGVDVFIDQELAIVSRQEFRKLPHLVGFPGQVIRSYRKIAALIREFSPDLIHTNTSLILPGAIAGKVYGIPHFWHVREIYAEFGKFWTLYQWFLSAFSDRILCVSQAVAKQFHRSIRSRKVTVLYNGFPRNEFCAVSEERVGRFREKYGLDGQRLIGLVGRIRFGRKGQDVFLKAASLLKAKYSNVKFLCIGSPFPGNEEHLRLFESLVEELELKDCVTYTGDVDDIKAAYAALDISVQCSTLPEAFGGVVIESMAMGKPIVATSSGGTLEQIEDGRSGILIAPGSEGELASALETLLNDEGFRQELSSNARRRFEEDFEFEKYFGRLMLIYDAVVKAGDGNAENLSRLAN